jgi:hypothetical protein
LAQSAGLGVVGCRFCNPAGLRSRAASIDLRATQSSTAMSAPVRTPDRAECLYCP